MTPAEPPSDERIHGVLGALLGATEPFRLEVIPSYSHVCRRVVRGTETFLLKIALGARAGAALVRGVEAQRQAAARGARVPELVAVEVPPNALGHAFVLRRWVPGRTVTEALGTAGPGALIPLARSLGRNAALIHGAAVRVDSAEHLRRLQHGGWREQCITLLESRARACESAGKVAVELSGEIARRCSRLLDTTLDEASFGLVHWDLHTDNVIVDGAEVAAVIDFDRADLGDPLVDFVKLDAALFAKHPGYFAPFLEGYATVSPLGPSWSRRVYLYQGIEYLSALSMLHLYPDEAEHYEGLVRRWLANERHRWDGPDSA